MRASQLYLLTLKEAPAEADIISHQLMIRAGLVRKIASGIYTWLPLGVRVLRKVEAIIREEMERVGAQECIMPVMQPAELWQATGRWEDYGAELMRFNDRHQRGFCLGPTHEEVITDLIRKELRSYKQLPFILYQIQTKFRDEMRPRFGVMRSREFLMKDAYSFHATKESLETTYQSMYQAYLSIFRRLGLTIKVVKADTGTIGGHTSHEFQVLSPVGEDEILYDTNDDYAINKEISCLEDSDRLPHLKAGRGIEVGHIFQLGDKYSKSMQARVSTRDGMLKHIEMGCYGIGVSRILAAAIEQYHQDGSIRWSKAMAPFQIAIIPVGYDKPVIQEMANHLYQSLKTDGIDVLLDDRTIRFGVASNDMNLIGIPHKIIVSPTSLEREEIEYQYHDEPHHYFAYTALLSFLKKQLHDH